MASSSEIQSRNDEDILFDEIETGGTLEKPGVPLNTPWTFWLDRSVPGYTAADVEANLQKVYTVNTVEGFWAVYNNIPTADKLPTRFSYHLMRGDIKPLWEDPNNAFGGIGNSNCQRPQHLLRGRSSCLLPLGNSFQISFGCCKGSRDEVCGISVSIRNVDDVIMVWNKRTDLAEEARITEKVSKILPAIEFNAVFYKCK
ncbi:eukaryotic translation initiation factor 4E family member 3 [Apostichopus japonicus]|uniref:Eukaryotic translation initiation factor 4E family member 3 n=1 Tax=Stichopus japonicus TaxID=307972 RepID=A0A2G8JSF2_STIJA|nr:eukaryotic translation initiation factor 4E family member 3 [Apostichopus japonicus]